MPRFQQDIRFYPEPEFFTLHSASLCGEDAEDVSDFMHEFFGRNVIIPISLRARYYNARIIVGELTTEEEAERLAIAKARLPIPCGRLVLEEGYEFEEDCREGGLAEIEEPPGTYLVKINAYLSALYCGQCQDYLEKVSWKSDEAPQWISKRKCHFDDWQDAIEAGSQVIDFVIQLKPDDPSFIQPVLEDCQMLEIKPDITLEKAPVGIKAENVLETEY